ncbi:unnamed protein product [Oikopleura dioica]|uniref:Uncharacterized protein n=1 Tax=Oikopleura dioica TaxID=34765 RepID=E4Y0V8_OIKDI|nr:unnamed protein product [Oikopleura dioica]
MIVLHHTIPTSSRLQAAIQAATPAGFLDLAETEHRRIPTTDLDLELVSLQELQQVLLLEMRTEDRIPVEEEDGLAVIAGQIRIIATRKDSAMADDHRLHQDEVHLQLRQKLLLVLEEQSADENFFNASFL